MGKRNLASKNEIETIKINKNGWSADTGKTAMVRTEQCDMKMTLKTKILTSIKWDKCCYVS